MIHLIIITKKSHQIEHLCTYIVKRLFKFQLSVDVSDFFFIVTILLHLKKKHTHTETIVFLTVFLTIIMKESHQIEYLCICVVKRLFKFLIISRCFGFLFYRHCLKNHTEMIVFLTIIIKDCHEIGYLCTYIIFNH